MKKQLDRYPGAQPFETEQKALFFGRTKDEEALCRMIRQESLTVLYSKSGLGKSSLVNAGVVPKMLEEGIFTPIRIRFSAFDKDAETRQTMPAQRTREIIRAAAGQDPDFLNKLIDTDETLWRDLKEQQISSDGKRRFLLIFDQFEELFTYPQEEILIFRKQLAEALYTPLPRRYWDILDLFEKESPLQETELTLLQQPLDLHILLAIRQDRIHLLGNLSDYLPTISKTWYELTALNELQARSAIVEPARVTGNNLATHTFEYADDAVDKIIRFLTKNGTEKIETTQLQVICHSLEQKHPGKITADDVRNLEDLLEHYYDEKIALMGNEAEQLAARRLIEEGLIYEEEERRLSLYEGVIQKSYGITTEMLIRLVSSHLLRSEPSLQGGYTYELSHDRLVAPVLKAKSRRLKKEKADLEELQKLEHERELNALRRQAQLEKQKRQRARTLAAAMTLLSIIALAALWFANNQKQIAVAAKIKAEEAEKIALESLEQMKIAQSQIYRNQGDAFWGYERFAEALAFYEKALELQPEDKYLKQQIILCKSKLQIQ